MPYSQQQTKFSAFQHPFPNFKEGKLHTEDFLNYCKGVVGLVELFGKVFKIVRYDMNGNIEKITKRYSENSQENTYVEDMILLENKEGLNTATDGLMWLRRGLHFISHCFQLIILDIEMGNKCEDISNFFKEAYSITLKKYHGWIGSNLFKLLLNCTPTRSEFIECISENNNNYEVILNDMKIFTEDLSNCVQHLQLFYISNNLEVHYKV